MKAYLTTMFVLCVLGVIVRVLCLLSPHPRPQKPVSIEVDLLTFLWTIGMLGWVSFLLYGATP